MKICEFKKLARTIWLKIGIQHRLGKQMTLSQCHFAQKIQKVGQIENFLTVQGKNLTFSLFLANFLRIG